MSTSKSKNNKDDTYSECKKLIHSFSIRCPFCNAEAVLYKYSDDSEQIKCFGNLHE